MKPNHRNAERNVQNKVRLLIEAISQREGTATEDDEVVHARTAGLGGWDERRLKGRRRPPARWKTDAETLKNVQGGAGGRNAPAFGKYIGLELYPPQHPLKLVSVTERQPPALQ